MDSTQTSSVTGTIAQWIEARQNEGKWFRVVVGTPSAWHRGYAWSAPQIIDRQHSDLCSLDPSDYEECDYDIDDDKVRICTGPGEYIDIEAVDPTTDRWGRAIDPDSYNGEDFAVASSEDTFHENYWYIADIIGDHLRGGEEEIEEFLQWLVDRDYLDRVELEEEAHGPYADSTTIWTLDPGQSDPDWEELIGEWDREYVESALREWDRQERACTGVTIKYESGGEQASITALNLWGREDWLGTWAAARPTPRGIVDRDDDEITYTAMIPGLRPEEVAEITEYTAEPVTDRWGRVIDEWGLPDTEAGDVIWVVDGAPVVSTEDAEPAAAERLAESLAEENPDRYQLIRGRRVETESNGGVLGQWLRQESSEWRNDYTLLVVAPEPQK